MRSAFTKLALVLVPAAGCAAGAVALADDRADLAPAHQFPLERQAADVPPEIVVALGAFRRAPTDADTVTSSAPRTRADTSGAQEPPSEFGHNRRLARRVLEMPEGAVFLVAGGSGVCFTSESHVEEGCQPTENVLSGNNAQAVVCAPTLPANQRAVYGVLPDGASNVEVTFSDGSVEPLKVANNAYSIRTTVPQPLPDSIRWDDAGGHYVVGTSMPRNANDTRCAGMLKPAK
jgi:hypothetical protein